MTDPGPLAERDAQWAADKLADLSQRAQAEARRFAKRRPKRVADVLAGVASTRGYAARRGSEALANAWRSAAETALGDARLAQQTRVHQLARGTLEAVVSSSALLQELTFHKPRLLAELQQALPDARIETVRLKVGAVSG